MFRGKPSIKFLIGCILVFKFAVIFSTALRSVPMVIPPNFPLKFYVDFVMWYTEKDKPRPPWIPPPPPIPYAVGKGRTFYDWKAGICVEEYDDFCIPIYEPNSYFPCIMMNYNATAYLMSPIKFGYGPCCVISRNFYPARPNFMQQFNYSGSNYFDGQLIDWWNIYDGHQLFGGYGFTRKSNIRGYRAPVTFWFVGNIGWAMQNFYNFTDVGPKVQNISKFRPIKECFSAPLCDSLPKLKTSPRKIFSGSMHDTL